MTEIRVTVTGVNAVAEKSGALIAGMVGIPVRFTFSPEWEGLNVIPVFQAGSVKKDNYFKDNCTQVPYEVLAEAGEDLQIGVEGRNADGTLVIPTVWTEKMRILSGAKATGDPALDPTPSQFDRFMEEVETLDEKLDHTLKEIQENGGVAGPKGEPGISVTHAWEGTVLKVTSASGTSSADLKGSTPQKGVDYWTDEDQAQIQACTAGVAKANALWYPAKPDYHSTTCPQKDGTFYEDSSKCWWSTGYVEIPNGVRRMAFQGAAHTTGVTALAFYDAQKAFICCAPVDGTGTPVFSSDIMEVPNNAVYYMQTRFDQEATGIKTENYTYYLFPETFAQTYSYLKNIQYSEQALTSGYVDRYGAFQTNKFHFYFSVPAANVESVTVKPLSNRNNPSLYYMVHVAANGTVTPYFKLNTMEEETVTLGGDLDGILYFNAFTDETYQGVTYTYVKEATMRCLQRPTEVVAQKPEDSVVAVPGLRAVNHHCVNKPYAFSGKTALFFGDSITYGWTGSERAGYGYPGIFSEKVGLRFANYGKNGSLLGGASGSLGQIPAAIKSKQLTSDFIFIAGGVNDWQMGIDVTIFRNGVANLCDYLEANYSGEVIFITPIDHAGWKPKTTPVAELQVYRDIITEIALNHGYSVVQGNLFGFPTEDSSAEEIAAMFGDKLHPTELGYQRYADYLVKVLCENT